MNGWSKPQELKITTELGKGSYGVVTEAHDEKGNRMASKRCSCTADGISNLLEASIMATIHHPYLNTARYIHPVSGHLYIFQEIAEGGDLAKATRRDRVQAPPSHQVRAWCFALLQAVQYLHFQGIIHGDIKASNVLLYKDGSIKLSDYSLSVKMWDENHRTFSHTVCTYTHRPLECLLGQNWDSSLDIWSLGCTFAEIAYGDLLFPSQNHLWTAPRGRRSSKTKKEYKRCLRERSVNCLLDWGKDRGENPNIEKYSINYCHYIEFPEFQDPSYHDFNSLLFSMLVLDPRKRPTATQLLQHPYFQGLTPVPLPNSPSFPNLQGLRRPRYALSSAESSRVQRQLSRYLGQPESSLVYRLAFSLYKRTRDLKQMEESLKVAACAWIASKLVLKKTPSTDLGLHQILSAERQICSHLEFRLHEM